MMLRQRQKTISLFWIVCMIVVCIPLPIKAQTTTIPPTLFAYFASSVMQPGTMTVATIAVEATTSYTLTAQPSENLIFISSDCTSRALVCTDESLGVVHLTFRIADTAQAGTSLSLLLMVTDSRGQQAQTTLQGRVQESPSSTHIPTQPNQTPTPSPTSVSVTPDVPQPDRFEPNNTPDQAVALPPNGDVDKLSFWPIGDRDFFMIEIKENQRGLTLTLETVVSYGLDTQLTVYKDGEERGRNDDISASNVGSKIELIVVPGTYLVVVDNVSMTPPDFLTYRLISRLTGESQSPIPTESPNVQAADVAENNYDFDHAYQIAIDEALTGLNFICPIEECIDNDFYWFPGKPGYCYVVETLDLAPGVDTNVIVYAQAADTYMPLSGNDDVDAHTFASRVSVCMPRTTSLQKVYVLVGNAGNIPPPAPLEERTYTLKVSLFRSEFTTPSNTPVVTSTPVPSNGVPDSLPTMTPEPTVPPTPTIPRGTALPADIPRATAEDPRSVIKETSPAGRAQVRVGETIFYAAAPPVDGDKLAVYTEGDEVELKGETYRGWVKVVPVGSVTVGWMWGPDLILMEGSASSGSTPVPGQTTTMTPIPGQTTAVPGQSVAGTPTLSLSLPTTEITIERMPIPSRPIQEARPQSRSFSMTACFTESLKRPTCQMPIENLRIEVLDAATQRRLTTDRTDRNGVVSFTVSVAPNTLVRVLIPSLGVMFELKDEGQFPLYIPRSLS